MTQDLQTRLLHDLVTESNESLDQFDQDLLALEKEEQAPDTLNRMFRTIHSLKGTSGCLGLSRIESLAHTGENLLSLLREGEIAASSKMISTLLAYSDALRAMLANLARTGSEPQEDFAALVRDLQALAEMTRTAKPATAPFGLFEDEDLEASASEETLGRPEFAVTGTETKPAEAGRSAAPAALPAGETAIRVDLEQLDGMMDLVGELVLARNQIMQFTGQLNEPALLGATQRLNIITTKLQETVMKTRMQPIGNVWNKFPRIVRDVSHELGKQVRLVMEGKDTDLDRNIIEAIKDPLTHLVRNAIDHGLEKPEQRAAAGKPAEGLLRLRAFHEGGQVNIEIHDDGAGIDREKVLRKAVKKGIVQAAQAAQLSDREIFSFIFAPGFSTADQVTNLSGRGVGMDVVKKNVERIGGSVDLQSEAGRSTTIRIKIPLTLAIIPALVIRCGGRRYAIPQVSLVELVRIDSENATRTVELVNGAPVYRLRGNLLPLVYLREHLGLQPAMERADSIFLLVLQAEGRQFGLVVDSISDTEEIVVKPLGKELKGLAVYAGATIMGDGCVALILDVLGIARRAHIVEESQREAALLRDAETVEAGAEQQQLLLFSLGESRQAAIPLSHVARLEEFDSSRIEFGGNSEVVQYRDEIMPLVRVARILRIPEPPSTDDGRVCVVVYSHNGVSVGLVVHEILDTVEDAVSVQKSTNRLGILGSGVVRKRVTDFLDVEALLEHSEVVCFEKAGV